MKRMRQPVRTRSSVDGLRPAALAGGPLIGRRVLALIVFGLGLGSGRAAFGEEQGAGRRPISLAEARADAQRQGPDVALAGRRTDIAQAEVTVAATIANPTVTVSTARETARLGTGLSLPLPLFGQRATAIAAARSNVSVADLEVEAARSEARWRATVAWLDLWEAQERTRLLADFARDADRVAAIADEKFKAGSAPRVDVLRTAADRARVRADAAFAAAAVPSAAARLAVAIGAPEGLGLAAEGAPTLAFVAADLTTLEETLPAHPILRRDRAEIEAAAARLRAQRRLRWPTVNAELAVNWHDPTLPGTDVIGGLSLEAPVFNLRGGAIARAEAERALAETTAELDGRRLRAELADAFALAAGAGARARSLAADVLPALEEAWHMTEEGYRDGRVDLLRLLDAQRARLESHLAEVEAEAVWQRAIADVERAAGVSLEPGSGDHAR